MGVPLLQVPGIFVDWKKQASHDGWKTGNLGIRDDSKDWPRKIDTTKIHGGGFNPFQKYESNFTNHFRYLKWRYESTLFSAVLGLGFPLH